ncbi:MAG: hypothetical protein BGO43_06570 [Gammaproteobacteria bacterium 39-13]|nr:HesA/MoeB/ThiF family protein [Gammaproteobacteria bacterium]OJV90507.1 MAG: hypothetical protein BGO43_06570 [Gammaproteobacteria bacterium 39-13]
MFERYARQIVLPQIGKLGQKKLQQTSVLCIGAGGLGSSALLYLASAGIGNIAICDNDTVSLDNLQRQVLYDEQDINKKKSVIATKKLSRLNSSITIEAIPDFLTAKNAAILSGYDYVLDASDNFATKLLLNDACHFFKKPLISASVLQFQGQLSVYCHPEGPCLRCLYGAIENMKSENCAEAGVLGMIPGWFGILQAFEIVKLCLNLPNPLIGKLCDWDLLSALPRIFEFKRDPDCLLCTGKASFATLWQNLVIPEVSVQHQISPIELFNRLAQNEDIFLLDVRNPDEHQAFNIGGTLIPLSELAERVSEIPTNKPIVLYCHSGYRSQVALELLQNAGFKDLFNLIGGVVAWQQSQVGHLT